MIDRVTSALRAVLNRLSAWKGSCFYALVRLQDAFAAWNPRGDRFWTTIAGDSWSGFRDPTNLTRWTKGFLYAHLALVLGRLCFRAVEQAEGSLELPTAIRIISIALQLLVFYGSCVLVPVWTRRANHNARQLGACGMTFTPGWAAAWYFLPPGLFWKPYEVMTEIWRASVDPTDWEGRRGSPLVGWWWALWLAVTWGEFLVYGVAKLMLEPADAQTVGGAVRLAGLVLHLPMTLFLLTIVIKVHRLQVGHYDGDRS
ncbi:MAG: DUF4328 domain-containing protein [Gemmatimonadetes bacterium]|nr:DUF4328 domain-containing protein [Gemmatimonadota bacterium]MYE94390.1 DUF4328 domain-containing protein [Gemmatimonadota bacterium]MYJ10302.1 DUF4328 domain-containing protein [Gemmatimonadota bacterium]